jgi:predicted kinase
VRAFQKRQNLLYLEDMAKLIPSKPFLLLLYGFPGAGKTYFARQLSENIQVAHLQADRIRMELFEEPRYDKRENEIVRQLMDYMVEEFLSAGVSVIYDSNVHRAAERHRLRNLAHRVHAQPLMLWFQMDTETAFSRNQKRDRRRADDKYAASWDRTTFEDVIGHMQNPGPAEDYIVVSGKHLYSMQQSTVVGKLRKLGVLTTDDAHSRVIKPGMVNLVPSANQGRVDMSRRNIAVR